jgi:hypothetical protein
VTTPAPVAGLYILDDDGSRASQAPLIERLSPSRAFPRVLANTATTLLSPRVSRGSSNSLPAWSGIFL